MADDVTRIYIRDLKIGNNILRVCTNFQIAYVVVTEKWDQLAECETTANVRVG